ncbi:MAG: hypothetical protein C4548_11425 [Desulfobacteraceae bacterium]|nr:MAG: hypothetical protein C4548_11425 [Desulfobacteraceae bacterium]
MKNQNLRRINYRFQIDANRINASGQLIYMNTLEQLKKNKVIRIMMAQPAQDEAAHGSRDRAKKAYGYIFTLTESRTQKEAELLKRIEGILFPQGAVNQNEKNDIEIVFNAWKYGCILVTSDGGSRRQPGGILGNRDKLIELGIEVLTDEEAVARIKRLILERDRLERENANITGKPLPEWVGRD